MANGIGDWFKRYWTTIVLFGLTLLGFVVYLRFFAGGDAAPEILKAAEKKVKSLKAAKAAELASIDGAMEVRVLELIDIKAERNEGVRLVRLAAFANRGKKS